ncbi:MAG: PilZ domain-containing protein [Deltaproteobacteria bacterium]|nr:PilZ domain-containing protein [Deltaproteobacteria bacterium]
MDLFRVTRGLLPNLVLLDTRMPHYEGGECLVKFRQDKLLDIIKVVMIGDPEEAQILQDALKKGAQGIVHRPVNPTELYTTIHNLIEPNPRQSLRLRLIFKVGISSNSASNEYFATTLSDRGLFIRTNDPLPVGKDVKVHMDLPAARPFNLAGKVVYHTKANRDELQEPGMCILFEDADDKQAKELRRFIENCLTGEIG